MNYTENKGFVNDEYFVVNNEYVEKDNIWSTSSESSNHPAGYRQELEIGGVRYGFCWIPKGEFEMGSPSRERKVALANAKKYWMMTYGHIPDIKGERLHHVKLTKGFWMLETQVTQALYQEVMKTNPSYFKGENLGEIYDDESAKEFPVETVSWYDAMKFCKTLTELLPKGVEATLPTEAQWEYACRAGTRTPYWFGDRLNGNKANCEGYYPFDLNKKPSFLDIWRWRNPKQRPSFSDIWNGTKHGKPCSVKYEEEVEDRNPWGLYRMHGNVWEWTSDWYGDYPRGTVTDPKGPKGGVHRVLRGGSWTDVPVLCRSASRCGGNPNIDKSHIGFRVLLSCD